MPLLHQVPRTLKTEAPAACLCVHNYLRMRRYCSTERLENFEVPITVAVGAGMKCVTVLSLSCM